MSTIAQLYDPIAVHLKQVEAVFEKALHSDLPCVQDLAAYVSRLRGKMLRPALLATTARACGRLTDEHYALAAVVEMLHMAALVHDDVLDEADVRRKAVTINRMNGNETAVMLGDFLFSRAYWLCSSLPRQAATVIVSKAAADVCQGELLQLHNRGNYDLDEETYYKIIDNKTAALTAVACQLGALYADADAAVVENMQRFGLLVGLTFQIVDDILDVVGREEQTGKTLGSDVRLGKLTLPMIHLLQQASNGDREGLLAALKGGTMDRGTLAAVLQQHGSLDYARQRARQHVAEAVECLGCLGDSPARGELETMARFIIDREF